MLVKRAEVFPLECVVRGYVSGSGWKEYRSRGTLGCQSVPPALQESARLPAPLFTPATKAESGHDENISPARAREIVGPAASELERLSLHLFDVGSAKAAEGGLILADTKFEFGRRGDQIILVDEVMTPDSSRFWERESYRAGSTPPSFDKQPLRDYLEGLRERGGMGRQRAGAARAGRGDRGDDRALSRRVQANHGRRSPRRGRSVSFAREGWPFIGIGFALVIIAFFCAIHFRSWPLWLVAVAITIVALWTAYFFRDPERTGPRGPGIVVAPADGKVLMITEVNEPRFIDGPARRISIFMNIFNVHVNRYPVDGRVAFTWYNKGKFLNAAAEKSSLENEQMSVGVVTPPA